MAEFKLSRFHYDERSQLWLEPFSELINGMFPIELVYGDWVWWESESEAKRLFNPESLASSSSSYLPTGSRVEGFCIPRLLYSDREGDVPLHERKYWTPDLDEMKVEECFIEDENNKSIAIFTPEHVSDDPRYVHLRFTDEWKEAKPRYKNAEFVNHTFLVPSNWFPGFVGQGWTCEMHGPVRKLQRAQNDSGFVAGIEEDQTGVFKYPLAWPKEAMEWIIRPRQNAWPSPELLQSIIESGCHLAPVGRGKRQKELLEYIDYDKSPAQASTSSRNGQDSQDLSKMDETEWRLSFSVAENKLGESVSPVQRHVLVLLKMIKKAYFPDVISSYHLKNLLFWEIEKQDKSFWMESNMSSCLLLILDRLQKSVEEGYLPHYIIPTSNLFCSEDPSELTQAAAVISDVRVNILPKTVSLLKRCLSMTYLTETFMKDLNDLETLVEKLHDKSLKEDDVAELMSLLLGVFIEKSREVLETIYQEQSRQPEEERENAETIKQMLLVPLNAYQSLLARSLCKAWYLKHNKTKENPSSHDFASFVKDEVKKLPLDDTFFDLTNLYFTEVRENRDMSLMIPYTSAMKNTKESHRKVAWKQIGDTQKMLDQELGGLNKSDLQEISKRLEEKIKCQNRENVTIEGLIAAFDEELQLLVSRKKLSGIMADSCTITYPSVRRDETIIDDYHGHKVPDPYAWLEDPDSKETKEFVHEENEVTTKYLSECDIRDRFKNRMTELWDYPKYGCPFKEGPRYFYFYNSGLQNQSVMYVQNSLKEEAKVFLDPNKLSDDGTTALAGRTFTEDGELFAYSLSAKGSDWVTIKFMKVEGAVQLPDTLEKAKFTSMSWTHDNKGLFYNQYPNHTTKADGTETDSNLDQKLYYHYLGTSQSEDILCCEFPEKPKWQVGGQVSDCGNYLLITPREGCEPVNRLFYCDLKTLGEIKEKLPYVKVVDNFDAEYEYITNQGTMFTFKTNLNSPRYKLINVDLNSYQQDNWTTLIPEDDLDVLEWASCVKQNLLVLGYLHDVKSVLHLHSLETGGRLMTFPLDIGSVVGFSGHKRQSEIFYQFTSFLTPGVIYHCDLAEEKPLSKVFREIVVKGFDSSLYQTDQVFFNSKDGTKIPMFIVHKKGISLDSSHPAFLYGYGGFSISITPSFSVSRIMFIHNLGGILAIANIRGGQEYGETWHKAGIFGNKQNVFDDFQFASKYLIDQKYTSPKKLTICGGSNGGLLVTACINQRPDLFGCAISQVPVTDMLKFHKFTIGHAWTTDFGCADKKEEFEWLIKYSPLHNVKIPDNGAQYPAVLLLTADHDDRVVPLHSFKYIAELQHVMGHLEYQKNPLLIRIDTKAGHGFGKPTAKLIEEYSDIFAFIARNVGATWRD